MRHAVLPSLARCRAFRFTSRAASSSSRRARSCSRCRRASTRHPYDPSSVGARVPSCDMSSRLVSRCRRVRHILLIRRRAHVFARYVLSCNPTSVVTRDVVLSRLAHTPHPVGDASTCVRAVQWSTRVTVCVSRAGRGAVHVRGLDPAQAARVHDPAEDYRRAHVGGPGDPPAGRRQLRLDPHDEAHPPEAGPRPRQGTRPYLCLAQFCFVLFCLCRCVFLCCLAGWSVSWLVGWLVGW